MKKVITILLLIFYASVSIIGAVSFHFCHDQLVDVSINQPAKSCCDDSNNLENNCCRNILIEIDIDDNQLVYNNTIEQKVVSQDCFISEKSSNAGQLKSNKTLLPVQLVKKPPGDPSREFYILNNSFLFYS